MKIGTLVGFILLVALSLAHAHRPYEVWVTNQGLNTVQIIDGSRLEVIGEIRAGWSKPHNITFTGDGKEAWVASVGSHDVTIIDTATRRVLATIPAGKNAHAVTFSPDGKRPMSATLERTP